MYLTKIYGAKAILGKYIAFLLSLSLFCSQIMFSFTATTAVISVVASHPAYAFNEIIPPQNIQDNPIEHLVPDNSIGDGHINLDRAQNGTPIVNINNANSSGISANYYKDFNVNQENLILNNHRGEAVNTQLGGVVYGNPNFNRPNGRAADLILNEITTNRVSNINGYLEVAGKRADVIIANPNGIMVSGGGFININRLSMITGGSLHNGSSFNAQGQLNHFQLTDTEQNPNAIIQVVGKNVTDGQGNVVAYNLGIDVNDVKYADLVSRIVKISGNIQGSDATEVNLKTGNDRAKYNAQDGFKVSNREDGHYSSKPEFSVDSTTFGGIYAGRINFIATEEGVGVRTRSDLVASSDGLKFDVNGDIILEKEGSLYAKKDINLHNKSSANHRVINKTIIAAENNVEIATNELVNQGSEIYALRDVNLEVSQIDNSDGGEINAGNDLTVTDNVHLNNQQGQIASGHDLTVKSQQLDNSHQGYIFAGTNMDLINLNNHHGMVEGNGNITITNGQTPRATGQGFDSLDNAYGLIASTNPNSSLVINTTKGVANGDGSIKSNGDINIMVLEDYLINGLVYSNRNINIKAKSIKNSGEVSSGKNILFYAEGDIHNGDDTTKAHISARNSIIFNILKTSQGGGSLYNYGAISADTDLLVIAQNSILNGLTLNSDARIAAKGNMLLMADQSLINRGYIQVTGDTGKLIIKTNAEINEDYELGKNHIDLDTMNDKLDADRKGQAALDAEIQAQLDNLQNITDVDELYELIPKLQTEEQYYLVQNRIKLLDIQNTFNELNETYTFRADEWSNKTPEEIEEQLQEVFGNNYDEELADEINGAPDNYLAQKTAEIEQQLQAQLERKQQAESRGETFDEVLLDKDALVAEAAATANNQKLAKIQEVLEAEKTKIVTYATTIDWEALNTEQRNEKLQDVLNNNYMAQDWSIPEYQKVDNSTAITTEYLSNLRINSLNTDKTEQTGIHNYGRIYSNNDLELQSNSVLHNNKNALIHANHDIVFSIHKVLLNNENAVGQGIFANHNITIQGYGLNPYTQEHNSLEKLVNYDGRIEANQNITIKSEEVINYGSDSIDLSKVDTTVKPIYDYYILGRKWYGRKKIYISKAEYEARLAKGDSSVGKTFKWYGVEETPELRQAYGTTYHHLRNAGLYQTVQKGYDTAYSKVTSNASVIQSNQGSLGIQANNITNYNSTLFANDNMVLSSRNLLNKNLEFNVNANQYYQYHGKKKKWYGRAKQYYDDWTSHMVLNLKGQQTAQILSGGDLFIVADSVGNGILEEHSNYNPETKLPYRAESSANSPLEEIRKTGTLNPLANAQLPEGNYGIFRRPGDPKSRYLFETDPTLVDLDRFLGSEYFMNRLGLDPYTEDLRFLGDTYMEHQLLSNVLNQQMTNHSFLKDTPTQSIQEKIDQMYANVDKRLQDTLGLEFGVAPKPEQLAKLDEDIIWYVRQDVTLADGSVIQDVLVPQIYFSHEHQEQMLAEGETFNLISGENVTIVAKSGDGNSSLNNSGQISANNQLVVKTDTINNMTDHINVNAPHNTTHSEDQASLTAKNTLILDTGNNGTVNNLSGLIALDGHGSNNNVTPNQDDVYNNLLYINTGTLNSATLSQQESVERLAKDHEYHKISTHLGDTATIQSNNDNSHIIIHAENDINLLGSKIAAEQNNANIDLVAGNDVNISAVQDYEYARQYTNRKDSFGGQLVKENVHESVTNKRSNIIADKSLTITSGKNLNSIGTNFLAKKDKLLLNVGNDLNLQDTKDYVYDYDYTMKSKLDFGAAMVHVATAVAVGALTGGAGAAAMAGASSAGNARSLTKGKVDSEMTYDENIVSNSLQGKRVALNIGHGGTMANTIVNGHSIENLAMLEQYTKLKLQSKDNFSITTSEARHEHQINHDTWNANVGRAVLGGALTGLASGAGATGGKYLSNTVGNALHNALGKATGDILSNITAAAINSATTSYTMAVGGSMSNIILNGGDFGDVLEAGKDAATNGDNVKSAIKTGIISGIGKAFGEMIKDAKIKYNAALTQKDLDNHMTPIKVEESNLKMGSFVDNKIGVNSYLKEGKIIKAGTSNKKIGYLMSNRNVVLRALNLLPGSPSFADFHDALNIPDIFNQISIIPAYIMSQFNTFAPYYKYFTQYNNSRKRTK